MARPYSEGFETGDIRMPPAEALAWADPMELAEMPIGVAIDISTSASIRNSGICVTKLKSGFDVEDARYGEGGQDAGDAAAAIERWIEHLDEDHGMDINNEVVRVIVHIDEDVDQETGEWKE